MNNVSKMNEFVFTWKIEHFNLSVIKKGQFISGPEFIVDSLEKTAWFLQIYPYGNTDETYVSCYLSRSKNDEGPTSVSINFTLSLVMADGTEYFCRKWENQTFALSNIVGCADFKRRDDLTKEKKIFLPNGALTVRCYIQLCKGNLSALKNKEAVKSLASFLYDEKSEAELPVEIYAVADVFLKEAKQLVYPYPEACTARTKLCIEKRFCIWNIENFSGLNKSKKVCLPLVSASRLTPTLLLGLYLDDEHVNDQHILVEIKKKNDFTSAIVFFCEITIMDNRGRPSELKHGKYFFDTQKRDQVWQFPLIIKVSEIVDNKATYLRNDTLSLHLSFVFSNGAIISQIEDTYYPPKEISSSKSESENLICLRNDIRLLNSESKLCDVTLVIGSKKFPAHRAILSARSPVFKAMFEGDMAEKASGIAELTDLDADTLTKMLTFMYGGVLGELECELAAKLYTASDKYQCIVLKDICHHHLISNLTVANVSDVLLLADMHNDKDMKAEAETFILSRGSEVLNSDEWDTFMKNHVKLAAETLNRIGLRFMNS